MICFYGSIRSLSDKSPNKKGITKNAILGMAFGLLNLKII
tara:strand:+ start:432 stop:551 length:120 start_codon:yes stop_codon:yes gene_type:complete